MAKPSEFWKFQHLLTTGRPERRAVPAVGVSNPHSAKILFLRNCPIEHHVAIVERYLSVVGISLTSTLGPYDDHLILWPEDLGSFDGVVAWIRINEAAAKLQAGIRGLQQLSAVFGGFIEVVLEVESDLGSEDLRDFKRSFPTDVVVHEIRSERDRREATWYEQTLGSEDTRRTALTVTRQLGMIEIPTHVLPPLKAILCDLDNTLYDGVLSEDGIEHLVFGRSHVQLVGVLRRAHELGVFVALVTKNEEADVLALIDSGRLHGLQRDFFARIFASWEPKGERILELADSLRIDSESMLFIDDNESELLQAGAVVPNCWMIRSDQNGSAPETILNGPWLRNRRSDPLSAVRSLDIASQTKRIGLETAHLNGLELHRELGTEVEVFEVRADSRDQDTRARVAELMRKTNQFNCSLQRTTRIDLDRSLDSGSHRLVVANVRDRFVNSGVVGFAFVRITETSLVVEELGLSCRVLGRHLEPLLISELIRPVVPDSSVGFDISFRWKRGPRNTPATDFLESRILPNRLIGQEGYITVDFEALAREVAELQELVKFVGQVDLG